jgi:enoyl-CoA hydratase/carnithine racemase
MFAMPETAIGFFPDIGATYVLPRLPGALGIFLGLTGHRLMGADAVHAGLATHFVPRERLPELSAALALQGPAALAGFAEVLPAFSLAAAVAEIDDCFSAPSLNQIIARLTAASGGWAAEALRTLRAMSPSALHWSLLALRRGRDLTLKQALDAELRMTRTVTAQPDFAEGVRAMVVDKDRTPAWQPPRIEDVDPAVIAAVVNG